MPISFNSKLSSSVANNTFLDKTIDDVKTGILELRKDAIDATAIIDTQDFINEIAGADGSTEGGGAANTTYTSNNYITDGDNRKVAIGKLDASVKVVDDIVQGGAFKAVEFANDAAYELAYGSPSGSEFYYNTTTGLLRQYNAVGAEWKDVGSGGVATQERIGVGNGATVNFNLTLFPTDEFSVALFLNGMLVELTDYSVTAGVVTFNTAPAAGQVVYAYYLTEGAPVSPPVTSGAFQVEYPEIDNTIFTNKQLTLSATPAVVTQVIVDVIGGSSQRYGVDYSVSGTTLSWNTLGLDGILNEGDFLRITYFS